MWRQLCRPFPTGIGQARISVNEGGFNLEGSLLIHSVAVHNACDLEARDADSPYALHLIVEIIAFQILLGADMREDTIALALPDIESVKVSPFRGK